MRLQGFFCYFRKIFGRDYFIRVDIRSIQKEGAAVKVFHSHFPIRINRNKKINHENTKGGKHEKIISCLHGAGACAGRSGVRIFVAKKIK
jgi:hypothetical protein